MIPPVVTPDGIFVGTLLVLISAVVFAAAAALCYHTTKFPPIPRKRRRTPWLLFPRPALPPEP